ncbi:transposase, partial [Halobacillus seohaensis]
MSISINYEELMNQLEPMLKKIIKEQAEMLMREEMKNFFEVEHPELKNSKNGSYERILDTRYGRIEDLTVPRDRNGAFKTQLFDPYQRRE